MANADHKRVKVYELKDGDWFDRGTGFCRGVESNDEGQIFVQSEDEPARNLLQTTIAESNGYQKQQDTLIVWTEPNGVDMALSFQEADGCAQIWEFVCDIRHRYFGVTGHEDGMSDDVPENFGQFMLPLPELENLPDVDAVIRAANTTPPGREALAKFVVGSGYIAKLAPLVVQAEQQESLDDLHRLCGIMKTLILLNDTAIIEHVVTDEVVLGVMGALEYDPDFPSHKANHRLYLSDESRFKEVVKIEDVNIKRKIHYTYRLQYLKDVVLARILDDPTFSVLNSLIFFHQVDIVQNLQANVVFLKELFGVFSQTQVDARRKKDAVLFIQQCCGVAKSLQNGSRTALYQNFVSAGLFNVITFALRHPDPAVRVAGTDILVALIDHDAWMLRSQIIKSIQDKAKPLTDTLIELLLIEVDLGVKSQLADAIKVLLDPHANAASLQSFHRNNTEYLAKVRANPNAAVPSSDPLIQNFYEEAIRKLFLPLRELESRESTKDLTIHEVTLYSHLVEVLCFFIRQHPYRSKMVVITENLGCRIAKLMTCSEKHLKLVALKYFRTCVGLHDEIHNRQIIQNSLFDPIFDIVFETMPRDNLLNSACLELFEFIKRENIKILVTHLAERYYDKLLSIRYVDTFQQILIKHEQNEEARRNPNAAFAAAAAASQQQMEAVNRNVIQGGQRWNGLKDPDVEEEAYFNGDDDDEDVDIIDDAAVTLASTSDLLPKALNASHMKSLVDYPDDEDEDDEAGEAREDGVPHDDGMDVVSSANVSVDAAPTASITATTQPTLPSNNVAPPAPERLAEKRRREEDEDDWLDRLTSNKRRSSSGSVASTLGSESGARNNLEPNHTAANDSNNNNNINNNAAGPESSPARTSGRVSTRSGARSVSSPAEVLSQTDGASSDISSGEPDAADDKQRGAVQNPKNPQRRKKGFIANKDRGSGGGGAGGRKLAISLSMKEPGTREAETG